MGRVLLKWKWLNSRSFDTYSTTLLPFRVDDTSRFFQKKCLYWMSWCSKIGLFIFIWPIICFYFCKNVGTCYDVLQTSKIGFTLIYLLLLYRILYMICTRCNLQQARMSILLKDSSSSSAGVSKQSRSSIYILNIRSWCNLPMLAAPLSFFILIRPSSARQA